MPRFRIVAALAALALPAAPALAQLPQIPGLSGSGSSATSTASGLLGGGLPGLGSAVGSTNSGNAAGLLSYCVQNQLVGAQSGAGSTLSSLTQQQPSVTSSSAYQQGQSGTLVTGQGQSYSLSNVNDQIKSKVCGMVLQHAKSML